VETFSDGMKKVRSGWVLLLYIKHVTFISLVEIYQTLKTMFDNISKHGQER